MYRILVADDEPIERTVIGKAIRRYFPEQLEVVEAVNGREAVLRFFERDCRIALLDIEMPGLNGLEAAEQIRERDKNCSIIFLTAFDEFSYAKRAISVRALDYLLKPAADEELVAALEEAVRMAEETAERTDWSAKDEREPDAGDAEATNDRVRMHAVAESIRSFIERHYKEDLSLQMAAEAMNYSDAYFCKIFKQCFDKSFTVYLTEYRMECAKRLLSDVRINIKDISQEVGYRDSNYFARVFKRVAGTTPTEYRMSVLRGPEGRKETGEEG